MNRMAAIAAAALATPALALAATTSGPPGGAAPKQLGGTWRTTLTHADVVKTFAPDAHTGWQLTIKNSPYLSYPRALGFKAVGSGGDTVPFAVTGNRLLLACLDGNGRATSGYGTYSFQITGTTMRFKLVKEPCHDKILRDRIIILTSEAWHRVS